MKPVRRPVHSLETMVAQHSAEYARLVGPAALVKFDDGVEPYEREEWEVKLCATLSAAGASTDERLSLFDDRLQQYRYMDDRLRQQRVFSLRRSVAAAYDEYVRFHSYECFVISYPKCGRTWMRHLIGSYLLAEARLWSPLQVEELSLNLDSLRGITLTHDDDPHLKHFSLIARSKKHFANKRVILLVRNPLDAIVSFFYQFHLRGGRDLLGMPNIEVRLDDFPAFEFGGLPNIVAFLNAWGRYIDSGGNVRIESYEALHRDSNVVLREALTYFGITPVDQELVRNASLRSTFSAMRRLETEGTLADPRLLPGDVLKKDTFKTREGRVGGYRDVLSATTIDWALEYISKNLLYPQMVEMS